MTPDISPHDIPEEDAEDLEKDSSLINQKKELTLRRSCGNEFKNDSHFCRKSGKTRPIACYCGETFEDRSDSCRQRGMGVWRGCLAGVMSCHDEYSETLKQALVM